MKVKLEGNKQDGYILSVENKDYYGDMAITYEEIVEIKKVLDKKLK